MVAWRSRSYNAFSEDNILWYVALFFLKLNSLITPNSLILLLNVIDLLHLNIGRNPTSTQSWKMYHCYHYHHHQLFIASSVCKQECTGDLDTLNWHPVFDLMDLWFICCHRQRYTQRRNKVKENKIYKCVCCCTLKLNDSFQTRHLGALL